MRNDGALDYAGIGKGRGFTAVQCYSQNPSIMVDSVKLGNPTSQ